MSPVEIRWRARAEHRLIEERLARIEALAAAACEGRNEASARLGRELDALRDELGNHLGWEARALPDALAGADAWGPERAARVRAALEDLRGA